MSTSDVSMSLREFRQYWQKNARLIRSMRAFDAADRAWVEGEQIFSKNGAYTLIVIKFKNGHILRVNVLPSLDVALAPEKYSNPGFWRDKNVILTYEEKEYLKSIGEESLTIKDLIKVIASSEFPGKEALVQKLMRSKN